MLKNMKIFNYFKRESSQNHGRIESHSKFNSRTHRSAIQTFNVEYSNHKWSAIPIRNRKVRQESGSNEQFEVNLSNNVDTEIIARVKKLTTLNEAIVYHQMNANEDSLRAFIPKFIGAFVKNGDQLIQLNLDDLLAKHSIKELCEMEEYKSAYLMINDLVDEMQKKGDIERVKTPKDFKFIKRHLQKSNLEAKLHGRDKTNFIAKAIRKVFFSLSKCSFALQKETKSSWFTIIINYLKRMLSVNKTKLALQSQFARLPYKQLISISDHLKDLKEAVRLSKYALADSSLLFIPIEKRENDQIVNDLEIHIIDLTHAFSRDELGNDRKAIRKHKVMQQEMQESLEELISIVQIEAEKKIADM